MLKMFDISYYDVTKKNFFSTSNFRAKGSWLFIWLTVIISKNIVGSTTVVRLVVNVPFDGPFLFRKDLVQPAIDYALKSLEDQLAEDLEGFKLQVLYRDSKCSHDAALWVVEEYYQCYNGISHRHNLSSPLLLLGPICTEPTLIVAAFAEHWNVPIISSGSIETTLIGITRDFSTLINITPTFTDLAFFVNLVFKLAYNRKKTVIHLVAEDLLKNSSTERDCYNMMVEIQMTFEQSLFEFEAHPIIDDTFNAYAFVEHLNNPQVVLMCAPRDRVRKIMIAAHLLNCANPQTNHWYVIDLHFQPQNDVNMWKRNDREDFIARQAYIALRIIAQEIDFSSQQYKEFKSSIEAEYKKRGLDEQVNTYAAAFHDAVVVYLNALKKTIRQRESLWNGTAITQNMKNITINGIGGPVVIDRFGHRSGNFNIYEMTNIKERPYKKVIVFDDNTKMQDGNNELSLRSEILKKKFKDFSQEKDKSNHNKNGNILDYTAMGGIVGGLIAVIVSCTLIFGGTCFWRKCNKKTVRSLNGEAHVALREEASVTTCMTAVDDDDTA